jgi:hypothetical protein
MVTGQFDENIKLNKKNKKRKKKSTQRNMERHTQVPLMILLWYAAIMNQPSKEHTKIQTLKVKWHRPEGKSILLLFFVNLLLKAGDVHPNPGPMGNDNLTCFFLNAQSIKTVDKNRSKLNDFIQLLESSQPDIFVVNESWLQQYIPDSLFADEKKYAVYRKDRGEGQGGGVIILVSRDKGEE